MNFRTYNPLWPEGPVPDDDLPHPHPTVGAPYTDSVDDHGTLGTEAQYMAMDIQYDTVSYSSMMSSSGNAAKAAVILGAVVFVAAIALAPATGGSSLAFAL